MKVMIGRIDLFSCTNNSFIVISVLIIMIEKVNYMNRKDIFVFFIIISILLNNAIFSKTDATNTIRIPIRQEIIVDQFGNGDYINIQDAIDNAIDGESILINAGNYSEQLKIYKKIQIRGAGTDISIIRIEKGNIIEIMSDNVSLRDLSLYGGGDAYGNSGIVIQKSENVTISDININSSGRGIFLDDSSNIMINNCSLYSKNASGIFLYRSENIWIDDCNISKNRDYGIDVSDSISTIITCNEITNNGASGIALTYSDMNEISRNIIENNDNAGIFHFMSKYNVFNDNSLKNDSFLIFGDELIHWNSNTISKSNLVNDKPLLFLKDRNNITIEPNIGQLILANCSNVDVVGLNISNTTWAAVIAFSENCRIFDNFFSNGKQSIYMQKAKNNYVFNNTIIYDYNEGISLEHSENNRIYNNNVSHSYVGIILLESENNQIERNKIERNIEGISIVSGSNNRISLNSFYNNNDGKIQAKDEGKNEWNSPFFGNYWDDYSKRYPTVKNDGVIWLHPYELNPPYGSNDNYPLLDSYTTKPIIRMLNPINDTICSGTINISGVSVSPLDPIVFNQVKIDNNKWEKIFGTESWNFSWDTSNENNGYHSISVRSFNGADYSKIYGVLVNIQNNISIEPPQFTLDDFNSTNGNYSIQWSEIENASEYELQESIDITNESWSTIFHEKTNTFQIMNRTCNDYWYRVRAINEYGHSNWSEILLVSVKMSENEVLFLDTPKIIEIILISSDGNCSISWTDIINADKYQLEESLSEDGPFYGIYVGHKSNFQFNKKDEGTYFYRVNAVNGSITSNWSVIGNITIHQITSDIDNDGIFDDKDAFPTDPTEWNDTDLDSIGDNSDMFPTDPAASIDTDGDGLPDSWNPGKDQSDSTTGLHLDDFPADPSASTDTDGDGMPDSWNPGKNQSDSTSDPPLELDPYPNDPDNIPPDDTDDTDDDDTDTNGTSSNNSNTWIWVAAAAVIVVVIALVVMIFLRKKPPTEPDDDIGRVESKPPPS